MLITHLRQVSKSLIVEQFQGNYLDNQGLSFSLPLLRDTCTNKRNRGGEENEAKKSERVRETRGYILGTVAYLCGFGCVPSVC